MKKLFLLFIISIFFSVVMTAGAQTSEGHPWICLVCGEENTGDSCEVCNHEKGSWFCPDCHTINTGNACEQCGRSFEDFELAEFEGKYYFGELSEGRQNGKGIWFSNAGNKYLDKSFYAGEWKDDTMDGKGSFLYLYAWLGSHDPVDYFEYYKGEFRNNLRSGFGSENLALYMNDNGKYDGEWENDTWNGNGVRILSYKPVHKSQKCDQVTMGRWEDGHLLKGSFIDEDCNIAELELREVIPAEFRDNYIYHARMIFTNGDVYEGEMKEIYYAPVQIAEYEITGHGTMTYANGEVYEGEWEEGSRIEGN